MSVKLWAGTGRISWVLLLFFFPVMMFSSSYCQQEDEPGLGLFYISGVILFYISGVIILHFWGCFTFLGLTGCAVLSQGLLCVHRKSPEGSLPLCAAPAQDSLAGAPTPCSPHAKEVPALVIVVMTLFPNSLLRQQCKPVVKHTIHYGHPQTEAKLE